LTTERIILFADLSIGVPSAGTPIQHSTGIEQLRPEEVVQKREERVEVRVEQFIK